MIKSEQGNVTIQGTTLEVIADFKCAYDGVVEILDKKFTEEQVCKIIDAVINEESLEKSAFKIACIITMAEMQEKEKEPTTGSKALDKLLDSLFGKENE